LRRPASKQEDHLTDRRFRLPVLVASVAIVAGAGSLLAPQSSATNSRSARQDQIEQAQSVRLLRRISDRRFETWRWQRLMGARRTPSRRSAERIKSLGFRRWVLRVWTRRAVRARRLALHPPRLSAWLCIHRYEGSWTDPNPPYFGGLQMDLGFQRTYGRELLRRKGTADNWTPLEQIWVAERAYRSGRGFYPWPNTARYCGLI
jgi:hypothetical protein